jgi:phage terminase large subunit-like protein
VIAICATYAAFNLAGYISVTTEPPSRGRLLLHHAARTEPFIDQITAFSNAAHDDMADMMTQTSAWLVRANWPTVTFSTVYL